MVSVNTGAAKAGTVLRTGDAIVFRREPPRPLEVEPENIPLSVLYEDADIIVIDKPPGIVVHPGAGNARGTLVNALLFHCRDLSGVGGFLRPGIVHRLDKNTSGAMVVAKNDAAHQALARQFKERLVVKRYTAIVAGSMPGGEGVIDAPIGRHRGDRKKMSTGGSRGRYALTRWNVLKEFGGAASLLNVRIETGRTHQIRVHLHAVGHPVLGDREYGGRAVCRNGSLHAVLNILDRQALHASTLGLYHPTGKQFMEFTAPLPGDMTMLLERLAMLTVVRR
jgi:23S rRNA pseudouridine1911/1915/1917 synthase